MFPSFSQVKEYLNQKINGNPEPVIEPIVTANEEGIDDHGPGSVEVTPSPRWDCCKPSAKAMAMMLAFGASSSFAFYYLITQTTSVDLEHYYGGDYDDSNPGDGSKRSLASLLVVGGTVSALIGAGVGLYVHEYADNLAQGVSNAASSVGRTFTALRGRVCPGGNTETQPLLPVRHELSIN
jgi:hypothetical protein